MISYRLSLTGPLLTDPRIAERFDGEISRMLAEVGGLGQQLVTTFTPYGVSGALRGSIFTEQRGTPARRQQIIGSPLFYAEIVEPGRRPGNMPPPAALERWVSRRLGVPQSRVIAVAFLVARKIGRRGYAGHHMFERAAARLAAVLQRQVRELEARIARLLRGDSA